MRLPFQAEAAEEFVEAAAWYERERPGYGALFAAEVERTVERASKLPQSGPRVPGMLEAHDVRRFVVRRFPYTVVTAMVVGQRAVVAIAHGRRRPGFWRDRLK